MKFSEKIKKLRREKGMTQEEVANAINISRQAYNAYEKGDVKPRTRATYDMLAKVLECDVEYLLKEDVREENMKAVSLMTMLATTIPVVGPALMAGVVATMAGNTNKKIKALEVNDISEVREKASALSMRNIEEYNKYLRQFSAVASGLILGNLAQKGIKFNMDNAMEFQTKHNEDMPVIYLEDKLLDTWMIKYCVFCEDDRGLDEFIKQMASNIISEFVFLPQSEKRKVSIVVNKRELFDYLEKLTKNFSYRGNFSIILIDMGEVRIVDEVYVTTYDNVNEKELLKII